MNRSNNGQRMAGKPPPPVPPRPSKSVVAEALAKSRQFKSPTRQAPPPPPVTGGNEIVKSKSSYAINVPLKKPIVFERSISEEVKNQGRPVIYQSPNVKCNTLDNKNSVSTKRANYVNHCINNLKHNVVNSINNGIKNTVNVEEVKVRNGDINVNNKNVNVNNNIVNINSNKVKITRKSSDVKIVSRSNSLKNRSNKSEEVPVPKPRSDPSKRNSYCGDKFVEKIVKIEDSAFEIKNDEKFDCSKSNSSTLEKSCDSSTTSSSRSSSSTVDKKNWDQLLNDRNHVNTLIDEMFASVLEVSPYCDEEDDIIQGQEICTDNVEHSPSITLPQDTTTIIVRSDSKERLFQETTANITPHDNIVVISNNLDDGSCSTTVTSVELLPKTVIVIKNGEDSVNDNISNNNALKDRSDDGSNYNSAERAKQVKFDDQQNHELLINELQCMKMDQEKILKRQRKPSMNIYDAEENCVKTENGYTLTEIASKIPRPDTLNVNGSGEGEVKIKTKFTFDNNDFKSCNSSVKGEKERLSAMSSLQHGLPPLPKSLSGFNLTAPNHHPPTPPRSSSIRAGGIPSGHLVYPPHLTKPSDIMGNTGGKKATGLDAKLAILRQEMYSLRQLDLSLLSQLWSLNESIQDFRQMLQEQEERVLSPPSPSPTPSSGDEEFYVSATSLNFRPSSVTTQTSALIRRQSTSSNASSLGG